MPATLVGTASARDNGGAAHSPINQVLRPRCSRGAPKQISGSALLDRDEHCDEDSLSRPQGLVGRSEAARSALVDLQQDLLDQEQPAERLRTPTELKPHPDRAIIPALSEAEQEALRADIAERGIQSPLELNAAGTVLDGHGRLKAALALGLEQVPVRVCSPEDERTHMLLAALRRRQLSASQRAALALELTELEQEREQARRRQRQNLKQNATEVATLPPRGERTREWVARLANAGARVVQDAETVRQADPRLYEQLKAGTLPAHRAAAQVRRARRYAQIGEAPPLPEGRFQLLYADPPWQLGNPESDYAPENYYPTLPLAEIKALPVPAAENAVLFLWAVNGLLPQAFEVIEAWGFEYKADIAWIKNGIGPGVWTRPRHELLFVARKGKFPPPEPRQRIASVFEAKRGRHSEKPERAYELIEQMYPNVTKLELFARGRTRAGWSAWGNEVAA